MSHNWATSSLAELLIPAEEQIDIQPDQLYKQITVRLWGKGVVLRGEVTGGEIATTRSNVARAGQFIMSRIDARNGAFGLVPETLEGAIVSNDFPLFEVNQAKLLPRFLEWVSKTHGFVELCRRASEGTTNRVRLKVDRLLNSPFPLPLPDEQRRIVAHIEALATRIAEARGLREQAVEEAEELWISGLKQAFRPFSSVGYARTASELLHTQALKYKAASRDKHNNAHPWQPHIYDVNNFYKLPNSWVWTDLGSVLTHLIDCVNDTPDFESYATEFIGLKSTNIRPYYLDLSQTWYMRAEDFNHWNRREKPKAGDIILTREAPMGNACILPEGIECCLTQRIMLLRCDENFMSTKYLLHFLNSTIFREQVLGHSRGLTHPHLRVGDAPAIKIPICSTQEQHDIVAYLDDLHARVNALKRLQAETAAELDAFLPAVLDRAFKGELV